MPWRTAHPAPRALKSLPIRADDILVSGNRGRAAVAPERGSTVAVLVVDDYDLNRKIVAVHLERLGYRIFHAVDGQDALDVLVRVPEIELVITDIMMPRLDGIALIERIRERPAWKRLPIIVCSARADLPTVKRAGVAGVRNYLVKPVTRESLYKQVRAALRDGLPALASTQDVMTSVGLDRDEYYELVWNAAGEVASYERALRAQLAGEPDVDSRLPDLTPLSEAAMLVGATRFAALVQQLGRRIDAEEEQRVLLQEIFMLRRAIAQRVSELDDPTSATTEATS
jgi:CheY-like chemotaxis protein